MFDRMMSLQTAVLLAIATEHRGIQIQRMTQQRRPQALPRQSHQGLCHFGRVAIGEPPEESPHRIRRGNPRQPQQPRQPRIAPIAGQMVKPFGAQRQSVPPGQQNIHDGNLMVGRLGHWHEHTGECGAKIQKLNVQPEQNRPRPHGDRMIRKRNAEFRVER